MVDTVITGAAGAAGSTTAATTTTPPMDWKASLPEEFKADEYKSALEKFKTPGDVVKSYVGLEKLQGKSIRIPEENATADELLAFRKKLGVPDKVEDYPSLDPKELPTGFKTDEEFDKSFKAAAIDAGLTKRQAAKAMQFFYKHQMDGMAKDDASEKESITKAEETLRTEWGANYDQRKMLAKNTFMRLAQGDADFQEFVVSSGLGNDPRFIRHYEKIGRQIIEDRAIDGKGELETFGTSKSEAIEEIKRMTGDKNHRYYEALRNHRNPLYNDAQDHRKKLYDIAYSA